MKNKLSLAQKHLLEVMDTKKVNPVKRTCRLKKAIAITITTISLISLIGCGQSPAITTKNKTSSTQSQNKNLIFDATKLKKFNREDMKKYFGEDEKEDCNLNTYEYNDNGITKIEYDKDFNVIAASVDMTKYKCKDPEKALKEYFNIDVSDANKESPNKNNITYTGINCIENRIIVIMQDNGEILTIDLLPYKQKEFAELREKAMQSLKK